MNVWRVSRYCLCHDNDNDNDITMLPPTLTWCWLRVSLLTAPSLGELATPCSEQRAGQSPGTLAWRLDTEYQLHHQ